MRRWIIQAVVGCISLTSFWASAQTPAPAKFTAVGSGSLDLVTQLWRDGYKGSIAPEFNLDIRAEGSGHAPKALTDGTAQFGLMSREMKAEEVAAFQAKMGYPPTRITVAMDALVILVNKNNPIKDIKIEQLDAAYSTSRHQGWSKEVNVWGDLGVSQGNWSNRPIVCWDRPATSGTRSFFIEVVLQNGRPKEDLRKATEEGAVNEDLIANQAAIGYGSMADVWTALKTIPIIPKGGKTAVVPTPENVASGAYPLSRFLFIYINKAPGKPLPIHVAGFLEYILSAEGAKSVKAAGQVPLPDELMQLNRRRLR